MRRHRLFLSTAAAACLIWPLAALADPPQDNTPGGDAHGQADHPDKAGNDAQKGPAGGPHGDKPGPKAPEAGGRAAQNNAAEVHAQDHQAPITQTRATGVAVAPLQTRTGPTERVPNSDVGAEARVASFPPANDHAPQIQQEVRSQHVQNRDTAVVASRAGAPALGAWNRTASGPARQQAGQQWRQANANFDGSAVWRQNSNWWRGNSAFRLFLGVREGYFFIPGLGYVSAPQEYRARLWQAGDDLPSWFWSYRVNDYWSYGLPQPPEGCAWVWVNDDVALVDLRDGYILDITHNAW